MNLNTSAFQAKVGREGAVQHCSEICTERLSLRPLEEVVARDVFENFDLSVTRYMVPRPAEQIEGIFAFIERCNQTKDAGSELILSIHRREDGEFVGGCGLHLTATPTTPELGIWIKTAAHGNGFGKEAILGLMDWAENNLEVEYFLYPVDRQNVPSRRIPESLGAQIIAEKMLQTMGNDELDALVFAIPPRACPRVQ